MPSDPMTTAHVQTAERIGRDVLGGGDLDALDELVTEDVVVRHVGASGAIEGRSAYRAHLRGMREAFADLQIQTELMAASDARVVLQWWATGTSEGPFMGFAPTGEEVRFAGLDAYRFRDGRIAELRTAFDLLDLLVQLDAVEAPWPEGE